MECPKCKVDKLRATKLEQDLSAMGCGSCDGALVSLLYYRDWVERSLPIEMDKEEGQNAVDTPRAVEDEKDSNTALACPKCRKLMTKFKVSGCTSNRLDLCASCDEVWLDGGEWELLKTSELTRTMPSVFTQEWQRKLKKAALEEVRVQRLLKVIDENEIEEIKRIRAWLIDHPKRYDIMFFLNHE